MVAVTVAVPVMVGVLVRVEVDEGAQVVQGVGDDVAVADADCEVTPAGC
jgi:hypothetical protein